MDEPLQFRRQTPGLLPETGDQLLLDDMSTLQ
jgi:hypothetical protein